MDAVVEFRHLSKGFHDGTDHHQVLDQINLKIHQGDAIALTGPSGSGKSTLLNLMAGFEHADQGELWLNGQATKHWQDWHWSEFRSQALGVVFQQFNLLTPLSVRDNIAFPLHLLGQQWSPWCDHLVNSLGIDGLLDRHIEQLSGGQQQRVAIARALAHKPKLLLADEPTGNLDETSAMQVMALLRQLSQEANASILMVTHSPQCAAFMPIQWQLHLGHLEQSHQGSETLESMTMKDSNSITNHP